MLPENINENQIKNWAQNELNLDLNEALIHEMLKKPCLQQVLNYVVWKVKNKRNAQKFFNHATMFRVLRQIDDNNQQFKDVIINQENMNEPSLFQSDMVESFDQFYANIAKSNHVKTMNDKFNCQNEWKNNEKLIEQLQEAIESMETNVFNFNLDHHHQHCISSNDSSTEIAKTLDMNLKNISNLYQTIQETSKENTIKIDPNDAVKIESSDMTARINELKDQLHRIRSSTLSWMNIIDGFSNKND